MLVVEADRVHHHAFPFSPGNAWNPLLPASPHVAFKKQAHDIGFSPTIPAASHLAPQSELQPLLQATANFPADPGPSAEGAPDTPDATPPGDPCQQTLPTSSQALRMTSLQVGTAAQAPHQGYTVLVSPDEALTADTDTEDAGEICTRGNPSEDGLIRGGLVTVGIRKGQACGPPNGEHHVWGSRFRDQGCEDAFWISVSASDPATSQSWPSNGLLTAILIAEPVLSLSPGCTGNLPMDGAFYLENERRCIVRRPREATTVVQDDAFRLDAREDDLFEMDGGALGINVGYGYSPVGGELDVVYNGKEPTDSTEPLKHAASANFADEWQQPHSEALADARNPLAPSARDYVRAVSGNSGYDVQHLEAHLHGRFSALSRSDCHEPSSMLTKTTLAPASTPSRTTTSGIRFVLHSKRANDTVDSSNPATVPLPRASHQVGKENPPLDGRTGGETGKLKTGCVAAARATVSSEGVTKLKESVAAAPVLKRPRGRPPKNRAAGTPQNRPPSAGAGAGAATAAPTRFSARIAEVRRTL